MSGEFAKKDLWSYRSYREPPNPPKVYLVTNGSGFDWEGRQWGPYQTKVATGRSRRELMTAFLHPGLACILHPLFCDFDCLKVWEASGSIQQCSIEGIVWCDRMVANRKMHFLMHLRNKMRFGFGCVNHVYPDTNYRNWFLSYWDKSECDLTAAQVIRVTGRIADQALRGATATDKHLIQCPEGFAALAAHFMALAAEAMLKVTTPIKTIEYLIAQSVMYATYAADQSGKPLPLAAILEKAFAARKADQPLP